MASKITKAYDILKYYTGENNYIRYCKRRYEANNLLLAEDGFDTEYIIKNKDYVPVDVNKTVKLSSDYAKTFAEKKKLDFIPEKIKIFKVIGEFGNSYHCFAQYRKSVEPQLMYLSKTGITTPMFVKDHTKTEIDFTPFNEKLSKFGMKLKPHQEEAVKFLVTNKKCVLADSMGLGKSLSSTVAALAAGCQKVLVITNASLKSTWKREIGYFEPDENIFIVKGTTWDGTTAKFTVMNYDIVKNYYEVAYENEYRKEEIVNSRGEVETLIVPVMVKDKKTGEMVQKQVKSRKKDTIKAALSNSPLFLADFDCVIIDEAQKLSNNTSLRYKAIYDFLSKSDIKNVYLVTGTPLTNTPMNLYHILRLIKAEVTNDYNYYVKRYCDGVEIDKPGEWNKWLAVYERQTGLKWMTMGYDEKGEAIKFIKSNTVKSMIAKGSSHLDELREKIKHIYIRRLASDIEGMVNKVIEERYYDLDERQKAEYDRLWDEYIKAQQEKGENTNEEYKQLVEGTLIRKFLANEMVENTKQVVDEYLEDGEKVIIVCNFTSEIQAFKEYYGKKCVVYDGKMTDKQKDKSEHEFMYNPKVKVFIGQIESAGTGLTLTSSHLMVFNSYSWAETSNRQMQDRIYRLTQKDDVLCIYQLFNESVSREMFEKVIKKGLVMDATIKKEDEK